MAFAKYDYFVSFTYMDNDNERQYGMTRYVSSNEINCWEDIDFMRNQLEANFIAIGFIEPNVCIINFQKLGYKVVSNGTDNHLILLDVKTSRGLTGKEAEELLDKVHITVNKNTIPNETEKATISSGIRIGSPAMTTRGLNEDDFRQIARLIDKALTNKDKEEKLKEVENEVLTLTKKYPLPY